MLQPVSAHLDDCPSCKSFESESTEDKEILATNNVEEAGHHLKIQGAHEKKGKHVEQKAAAS